jgi:hypothetical protein
VISTKNHIALFLILSLCYGCEFLSLSKGDSVESQEDNIVARVHSSYLFKEELEGLIPNGMSSQDSLLITQKFVTNWVKKELLVLEAANNIQIDQSQIERKVADYRYALISYEYQKLKVNQALNKEITEEEILAYYNDNLKNFILKQNIIQGRFIKVSNEAPRISNARRWIKSSRPEDLEELKSYSFQFASNYSLEDSTWINFDEVIKNSPFSTISNKIQFLSRNRYVEESDSSYLYLFKIDRYKISNETSPLEFVKDDIKNIILNKRRVDLAKNLENGIYERAKENEDFEIFK